MDIISKIFPSNTRTVVLSENKNLQSNDIFKHSHKLYNNYRGIPNGEVHGGPHGHCRQGGTSERQTLPKKENIPPIRGQSNTPLVHYSVWYLRSIA